MEENLDTATQEHQTRDPRMPQPRPVPKLNATKEQQMAMAALIMGLLGLPLSIIGGCCCLTQGAITLDVGAVILGVVAMNKLRALPVLDRKAFGNARVGVILGVIGALLYIVGFVLQIMLGVGVSFLEEFAG